MYVCRCAITQFKKFNDGHTILSGPGENGINVDGNYTFILADYLVSASPCEFPHTLTRLVARERKAPAEIRLAPLYFSRATVVYRANLTATEIVPAENRGAVKQTCVIYVAMQRRE